VGLSPAFPFDHLPKPFIFDPYGGFGRSCMQPDSIKVLLIEDVPKFARLMQEMLQEAKGVHFEIELASSLEQGLARLPETHADVVLLDLSLSQSKGLESFEQARNLAAHVPMIVLSSLADEDVALHAVQEGAQDYLVKGEINSLLLVRSIRYAIERKRAEMAVLQAEEKYRSIFEHIVEGIFQTTPDGHYISANPALARIYGYDSSDELIARLTDIAHQLYIEPGRRAEFIRLMDQNDVVRDFESRVLRRDGSIIWISENVRAVRDEKNRLLYYEGTVEDITQRKRGEEEVRNSEALYHSLVEHLPQNIFRKDLNERFTFANQRFCQTLGKSLDQIIGKTDFDFFPAELAAKYQQDDRKIMEAGEAFETVEEHVPPSGEKLYVNVIKTPLYDSKGQIIGLQGIFWDITERRRAEERLRRTTLELAKNREELRTKNEQMEEDLRMAREIQQAIIPQQYPTFPKSAEPQDSLLRFCHRYFPTGAVGGDFFNVRALSDTTAGVFICDVMGHGVRSALVTAIMRALVEELADVAIDPGRLLGQINQDVRAILRQSGTPMFTTGFYMVADVEQQQLHYANAGHPKPLLIHRDSGQVDLLLNTGGKCCPALGLFEGSIYPTSSCPLLPGDLVVLFTDGLYDIEGIHPDRINPDWILAEIRKRAQLPAPELFDQLLGEIRTVSENASFADDVCLVGMEVSRGTSPT
jgi:sigma-B regulation protein RsbU (phosphoserine phosphatase)